jgi:hypothetical protein
LTGILLTLVNYIAELQLGGNRFRSALPSDVEFLTNLSKLAVLEVPNDSYVADSHSFFIRRVLLEWLSIESNGMTGTIPSEWDGMTKLEVLLAHDNDLVGSLDGEIVAAFTNLQQLHLDSNLMVGSIPSELGSLGDLKDVLLQSNNFRGSLPSELGNLGKLGKPFRQRGSYVTGRRSLALNHPASFHFYTSRTTGRR